MTLAPWQHHLTAIVAALLANLHTLRSQHFARSMWAISKLIHLHPQLLAPHQLNARGPMSGPSAAHSTASSTSNSRRRFGSQKSAAATPAEDSTASSGEAVLKALADGLNRFNAQDVAQVLTALPALAASLQLFDTRTSTPLATPQFNVARSHDPATSEQLGVPPPSTVDEVGMRAQLRQQLAASLLAAVARVASTADRQSLALIAGGLSSLKPLLIDQSRGAVHSALPKHQGAPESYATASEPRGPTPEGALRSLLSAAAHRRLIISLTIIELSDLLHALCAYRMWPSDSKQVPKVRRQLSRGDSTCALIASLTPISCNCSILSADLLLFRRPPSSL